MPFYLQMSKNLTQQRDIYDTVIFRFLQIFYGLNIYIWTFFVDEQCELKIKQFFDIIRTIYFKTDKIHFKRRLFSLFYAYSLRL